MNTKVTLVLIAGVVGTACASTTPGAKPHDMSVAQHEAMAAKESATATTHSGQYDPNASAQTERCGVKGACWTSTTNPTAVHLEDAKKHQKMAADHRAASQALRDAEARACVGLADADRDTSPFDHREEIASVEPLTADVASGIAGKGGTRTVTEGAIITFRAVPGMTAQWLQRLVDCHLARNAALGHEVPEMPLCPLVLKNVTATVTPTDSGFAVAVRSNDSQTVQEVLRRSRALVGR